VPRVNISRAWTKTRLRTCRELGFYFQLWIGLRVMEVIEIYSLGRVESMIRLGRFLIAKIPSGP
jgi:hypothetical protein